MEKQQKRSVRTTPKKCDLIFTVFSAVRLLTFTVQGAGILSFEIDFIIATCL